MLVLQLHLCENTCICSSILIVCLVSLFCAPRSRRGYGRQVNFPFLFNHVMPVLFSIYILLFLSEILLMKTNKKMGFRRDRADVNFKADHVGWI